MPDSKRWRKLEPGELIPEGSVFFYNSTFGAYDLYAPIAVDGETFQKPISEHAFTKYVGFIETYEFCTKCDVKRGIKL